ncbi:MAG: hypothetical protein OEM67_04860 [Thermoleophilia bacterium]|nr:hypothetical protein [Thermoleophilia bacterium]MDH3724601.1 hypothetical protein [Thermoleophilia bacterium]
MSSPLADCALPLTLTNPRPPHVLAPLGASRLSAHADGLDLILEGFLLHHGRPRLATSDDADARLLAGDYCYARGLVRVAEAGDLGAIGALSRLIALSSALVAEGERETLAALWTATARAIGEGDEARERLAVAVGRLQAGDRAPISALASSHPETRDQLIEAMS